MEKVFKFKTRKGKKIRLSKRPVEFKIDSQADIELKPIQGIYPQSKEEYYVAIALDRLGLDYIYQFDIAGGRAFRGGQVIDFFVFTKPLPTPVFVQGSYWHGGVRSAQTHFNVMRVEYLLGGQSQKPVELWDHELPDPETAYQVVKRKIS